MMRTIVSESPAPQPIFTKGTLYGLCFGACFIFQNILGNVALVIPTDCHFRGVGIAPTSYFFQPFSGLNPQQPANSANHGQDKIVCTAAIASCANGHHWRGALRLLRDMPLQRAEPDVSSCLADPGWIWVITWDGSNIDWECHGISGSENRGAVTKKSTVKGEDPLT